ncbi:hypothetical protein DK37_23515 [Halomonas sp. SUBG004]|nr:hypothetical protein DK37_23515 [Halomonas sp. SUBG004]
MAQRLPIRIGIIDHEEIDGIVALVDHAVSPLFQAMKSMIALLFFLFDGVEKRLEWPLDPLCG